MGSRHVSVVPVVLDLVACPTTAALTWFVDLGRAAGGLACILGPSSPLRASWLSAAAAAGHWPPPVAWASSQHCGGCSRKRLGAKRKPGGAWPLSQVRSGARPRNACTVACPTRVLLPEAWCGRSAGPLPTESRSPSVILLGIPPRVGLAPQALRGHAWRDVPTLPPGGRRPSSGKFQVPGPPVASPGPGVDSAGVSHEHGLQTRWFLPRLLRPAWGTVTQELLGRIQETVEHTGWKCPDPQQRSPTEERPRLPRTPCLSMQPFPPQWTVDGLLSVWGEGSQLPAYRTKIRAGPGAGGQSRLGGWACVYEQTLRAPGCCPPTA